MTDFINNPAALPYRGIRNNNPFNMVKTAIKWQGKIKGTDTRFESFDTLENGIRAGIIDIVGDIAKDNLNNLESLFKVFAPPFENDTVNYINYVSKVTGKGPKEPLAINGKIDPMFLYKLATAIITHENGAAGAKLVSSASIKNGVNLALKSAAISKYISKPSALPSTRERLNDFSGLIFTIILIIIIFLAWQ
jgi:hypothetical protein